MLSDVTNLDYFASIDPSVGILRPTFTEDNIRLMFDSDASTGVVRRGDNVYINYTESTYISQDFATKAVKINPYSNSLFTGNLRISPASDEWKDKKIGTRNVIDGGERLSTNQAANWNNWEWNWGGKDLEDLKVGDEQIPFQKLQVEQLPKL